MFAQRERFGGILTAERSAPSAPMATASPNPQRILLVEPEATVATPQSDSLVAQGYEVVRARTGAEALEVIQREHVDLVLMEVSLPDEVSGTEVARRITATRDTPIVFLTAAEDAATVAEIRTVTRYGYVLKRSGPAVLSEVIRLALDLAAERRELRHSRDLFESITNLTGDVIVRHDVEGNWVYLNDAARRAWNVPEGDLRGINYLDHVDPADLEATRAAAVTMRETHRSVSGLVNRVTTVDGLRTFEWSSTPIFDRDGRYIGFQSNGRDITEKVAADQRIRDLLAEREVLLNEINHRVKNDLAFVGSLLSLQAWQNEDTTTRDALTEAADRVAVIARVYDTLSHSPDREEVELKPLLDELVLDLTMRTSGYQLKSDVTLDGITVPIRFSVNIGIIVNELLTNAGKYAAGEHGATEVTIAVNGPEPFGQSGQALRITISDDGPGFPEPVLRQHEFGFGLTIVNSLVSQYEGTVELANDESGGATIDVTLPLPENESDRSA
jgi:PAS domain S-box-containing protein